MGIFSVATFLVFIGLGRTMPDIFYFKGKAGRGMDFVAQGRDRSRLRAPPKHRIILFILMTAGGQDSKGISAKINHVTARQHLAALLRSGWQPSRETGGELQ